MKKRIVTILIASAFALGVTACGSDSSADTSSEDQTTNESTEEPADEQTEAEDEGTQTSNGSHVLIAYFSMPEDIDTEGIGL